MGGIHHRIFRRKHHSIAGLHAQTRIHCLNYLFRYSGISGNLFYCIVLLQSILSYNFARLHIRVRELRYEIINSTLRNTQKILARI